MQRSISNSKLFCPSSFQARLPSKLVKSSQAFTNNFPSTSSAFFSSNSRSNSKDHAVSQTSEGSSDQPEPGRLSQQLSDLTDEALQNDPKRASKLVDESGFSSELKQKLQERIASANFRSDYAQAISQTQIPESPGKHVRDIATATPWSGAETPEDSVLRMLTDAHKPLKGPKRGSSANSQRVGNPINPNIARRAPKRSAGQRIATARDQSSNYALSKETGLTEQEKERMRQDLRDRFEPGARAMPNTIRGLQSLANERIEDAIGRGLFNNLPRGKQIERDHNASSPFIDTTEYLLNRLVQRQDIVPPWIEKQQQISRDVGVFRARLRNDWKRHAARVISSKGGTLQDKILKAEAYARAEERFNPKPKPKDGDSLKKGSIEALATTDADPDPEKIEQIVELLLDNQASPNSTSTSSQPENESPPISTPSVPQADPKPTSAPTSTTSSFTPPSPSPHLFRDPTWEASENSYHNLSISALNSLTRSYNLMAPDLAKKPYFSLDRELSAAFRDVAPLLAEEIHARATAPSVRSKAGQGLTGEGLGGVFGAPRARVHDEVKPRYGLKEFLRDLWGAGEKG